MNTKAQIQCLLYQISQARLILQKRFRTALKQTGLELGEFYALTVLQDCGIHLARDLAHELNLTPATVSVMLKKMTRKKLVEQSVESNDSRHKFLVVSVHGKKQLARAKAVLGRVDAELNKKFEREILQFRIFYKKLIQEKKI